MKVLNEGRSKPGVGRGVLMALGLALGGYAAAIYVLLRAIS